MKQARGRGPRTGAILAFVLLLTIGAGGAAARQDGSPPEADIDPDSPEIVVTGDADRLRRTRDFVAAITVQTDEQIARFADPVCPASFGLSDSFNAFVVARLRHVAQSLDIRVAQPGCRPNILIVAADRGRDLLAALRRRRPALLAGLELAEIRRLSADGAPVRSWQIVEQRGSDGREMQRIAFIQRPDGTLIYIGNNARQLNSQVASRLARSTRQDIALAVVMFDVDALEGRTLAQIADYAAMRAFARTDPARAPDGRSILALFDASSAPAGALTALDAAYLRALYATDSGVGARQQRANITRAVLRDLDAGDSETRLQ